MRVYLVRHGQTAWNAERRNQGHTDIPLNEEGRRQARLLIPAFAERLFTRILCSDLERNLATARPLAEHYGIPIEIDPRLRERGFGDWESQPMARVAQNFIEQALLSGVPQESIRPPNGESLVDVWTRQEGVAQALESGEDSIVVVCHGGSGSLLLARLLGGTHAMSRSFRMDNTGITTLERRPDRRFQMLGFNDFAHLSREALSSAKQPD